MVPAILSVGATADVGTVRVSDDGRQVLYARGDTETVVVDVPNRVPGSLFGGDWLDAPNDRYPIELVAQGDFDRDGLLDIVWRQDSGGGYSWRLLTVDPVDPLRIPSQPPFLETDYDALFEQADADFLIVMRKGTQRYRLSYSVLHPVGGVGGPPLLHPIALASGYPVTPRAGQCGIGPGFQPGEVPLSWVLVDSTRTIATLQTPTDELVTLRLVRKKRHRTSRVWIYRSRLQDFGVAIEAGPDPWCRTSMCDAEVAMWTPDGLEFDDWKVYCPAVDFPPPVQPD